MQRWQEILPFFPVGEVFLELPLLFHRDILGHQPLHVIEDIGKPLIVSCQDLGGKNGGIPRSALAYGHGGDWDSRGHLHGGKETVEALKR